MSRGRPWTVGSGGEGTGISRVVAVVVEDGDGDVVVEVCLEGFRRVERRERGVVVGFLFRA